MEMIETEKEIRNPKCSNCGHYLEFSHTEHTEKELKQSKCEHDFPKTAHNRHMYYEDSKCKKCKASYMEIVDHHDILKSNIFYCCLYCGKVYLKGVGGITKSPVRDAPSSKIKK